MPLEQKVITQILVVGEKFSECIGTVEPDNDFESRGSMEVVATNRTETLDPACIRLH